MHVISLYPDIHTQSVNILTHGLSKRSNFGEVEWACGLFKQRATVCTLWICLWVKVLRSGWQITEPVNTSQPAPNRSSNAQRGQHWLQGWLMAFMLKSGIFFSLMSRDDHWKSADFKTKVVSNPERHKTRSLSGLTIRHCVIATKWAQTPLLSWYYTVISFSLILSYLGNE